MTARFFLFSSDAAARYRMDIVKALALPRGATIQFRYDDKYLPRSISHLLRGLASVCGSKREPFLVAGKSLTLRVSNEALQRRVSVSFTEARPGGLSAKEIVEQLNKACGGEFITTIDDGLIRIGARIGVRSKVEIVEGEAVQLLGFSLGESANGCDFELLPNAERSALLSFVHYPIVEPTATTIEHRPVEPYPCREGTIERVFKIGAAWALQIVVDRYAHAPDPLALMAAIAAGRVGAVSVPQWGDPLPDPPPKIRRKRIGDFVLRADVPERLLEFGEPSKEFPANSGLEVWEKTVRQFHGLEMTPIRDDVFYGYVGSTAEKRTDALQRFHLVVRPGKELILRFCHFARDGLIDADTERQVAVHSQNERLYASSHDASRLHSRYDLHEFHFRGRHEFTPIESVLRVSYTTKVSGAVVAEDMFDLEFSVTRSWLPVLAGPASVLSPLVAALAVFFSSDKELTFQLGALLVVSLTLAVGAGVAGLIRT